MYIGLNLTHIGTLLTHSTLGRLKSDWTNLAHCYVERQEVDESRTHQLSVIQASDYMLLTGTSNQYTIKPTNHSPLLKYRWATCQAPCRFAYGAGAMSSSMSSNKHLISTLASNGASLRARYPIEASPSSRSCSEDVSPHIGAESKEGSLSSSSKSHTASTPTTIRLLTQPPLFLLLGCAVAVGIGGSGGRGGRGGRKHVAATGSTSFAVPMRKGQLNASLRLMTFSKLGLGRCVSCAASACAILAERLTTRPH